MATLTAEHTKASRIEADLRWGSWVMGAAAVGFICYAVIFFIRNFTDSFLELGIGRGQVSVGKDQIQAFSPSLYHYIGHLHIAVSAFIAAPVVGLAVALPAHYPYHLDTIGHLGLIYLATAIFVVGALIALRGLLAAQ